MSNDKTDAQVGCPAAAVIGRAANDAASPDELATVMAHLDTCEACRDRFDRMMCPTEDVEELRSVYAMVSQRTPDADAPRLPLSIGPPTARSEGGKVVLPNDIRLDAATDPRYLARLGSYDVVRILGAGGMGTVLLGWEESLQRQVALKVLAPHATGGLLREARTAAKLSHPNIVTIYAVADEADPPYIAMEFVPGRSLASLIAEEAPVDGETAAQIAAQVLRGLEHAHQKGIVHRDVKPANVLIDADTAAARLLDFGIARAVSDVARPSQFTTVTGTPAYLSPEQAAGDRDLDARSDLFAAGSVLFEMLTGAAPFSARQTTELIRMIREDDPPDLATLNPYAPTELIRIVRKAMEKDRSKRYQHAREFAEDLERFLAGRYGAAGTQVAATAGADVLDVSSPARRQFRKCSVCSTLITSQLSQGGQCSECGQTICLACWSGKGVRHCPRHTPQSAPSAADSETKPPSQTYAPLEGLSYAPRTPSAPAEPAQPASTSPPPDETPSPPAASSASPAETPPPLPSPPAETADPATQPCEDIEAKIAAARAEGRPAISAAQARLSEQTFLRLVENYLGSLSDPVDPIGGEPLGVKSWSALASRTDRQSHLRRLLGDASCDGYPAGMELVCDLTRWRLAGPRAPVVIRARCLSHIETFAAEGFDDRAVTRMELESMLNDVARQAFEKRAWHLLILASPTGWAANAVDFVVAAGPRAFRDRMVSVVLYDQDQGAFLASEGDERLTGYREAFSLVLDADLESAREFIRRFIKENEVVWLEVFLTEMAMPREMGVRIFKALGAGREFRLHQADDGDMILGHGP